MKLVLAATAAAALHSVARAQGPYPNPNLAESVLLTDAANAVNARCLDGTPQRYWLAKSNSAVNSTKWYIHFMGGGWCESTDGCASRAYAPTCYIGSSNPACMNNSATPGNSIPGVIFNQTMDFRDIPSLLGSRWGGGLINNDPVTNPLTWDWNRLEVAYCSGESYTGALDTPVNTTYNGQDVQLWYRGRINMQAILDDLLTNQGLDKGTDMIVSGDSAGGLASFWHTDFISSYLAPYGVRVTAAPDSGYFFSDPTYPPWTDALRWVVSNSNGTGGLNPSCVAHQQATGGDPLDCSFPEVSSAYALSPTFIMNSRFDSALDDISGGENGKNVSNVNRLGARLLTLLNASALALPGNAAFITSCHEHCGQWAQGQVLGPNGSFNDFNVTIIRSEASGSSVAWQAVPALQSWYTWLHSESPWQHSADSMAQEAGSSIKQQRRRVVHDDLITMRAQRLSALLTSDGVPKAQAQALALPRWVQERAPPATAGVGLEALQAVYGRFGGQLPAVATEAEGSEGEAQTAQPLSTAAATAAPSWVWVQPALYPCNSCCAGGQS